MTPKGIAILVLGLVLLAIAAANAPDLWSQIGPASGVGIVPPPQTNPTVQMVMPSGTFSVNVQNTIGVQLFNTPGVIVVSSVPVSIGSVVVNPTAVQFVAPQGTFSANIQNTIGAQIFNTPAVIIQSIPTAYVTGVPVPVGSVFVNNPLLSPIPIATGTAGFRVNVDIQTPAMTMPVSFPQATLPGIVATVQVNSRELNTVGIQMLNTPAVQGSVSINNTPDVVLNDRLSVATTMATSGPPGNVVDTFAFGTSQALIEITGTYTGTISFQAEVNSSATLWAINAYPLTNGEISGPAVTSVSCAGTCTNRFVIRTSGLRDIRLNMTAYTSGTATVWVDAGPGAVSNFVLNTPGVAIQNTPAVQGSVSINNTPAVQGSVSINNTPAVIIWNTPLPVAQASLDPCQVPGIAKSFATFAIVSSATAIITTPSAAQKIYVCGILMTQPATDSITFSQASATASLVCPSNTPISGAFVGGPLSYGGGGQTIFSLGTGQKLCGWAQGTAISEQGLVSFVAQ